MEWKQFRSSNYFVCENGMVKNMHGKILKPTQPKLFKYAHHVLTINGKQNNLFVHRLVAECFIANPNFKSEVNHKDGNKLNNHVSNLEWVTREENIQHMYDTGLKKYRPLHYKGKFGAEHNRSKKARCIELDKTFGSMSEAERELNIGQGGVSWSIKNKAPINGFHFEAAS